MTSGRRYRGSNKVTPQPPPPAHSSPSFPESPSFFSTMTQGLALGAGSSMGHRAVDALFGSSHKNVGISTPNKSIAPECQTDYDLLLECIKSKDNDHCSAFHEAFIKCNQK